MEHTELTVSKALKSQQFPFKLLRASLVVLPYLSYLGLLGLLGVIVLTLKQHGKQVFQSRVVQGLMAIAAGLILNAILAFNIGEACLQLANFIPFFLLFAVFITLLKTTEQLQNLAWSLLLTSIPINLLAIVEYGLKFPSVKASLSSWSILAWFYRNDYGHRANSFFGHPNTYASYLIIILGFGLGLTLQSMMKPRQSQAHLRRTPLLTFQRPFFWLYSSVLLTWAGIFCAGSRNGLLIALSQLVGFILIGRKYWVLRLTGLLGLVLLVSSVLIGGIGDRQVNWQSLWHGIVTDPRVSVWQIALDLTREKPWLGWGLGNYKLLYPDRSVRPDYPYIGHAHNFWLLMTSEAGIPIAIAITLVIGYICYRGLRVYLSGQLDTSSQALLMGYLFGAWSFIIFALLDLPFYDARINALNWFVLSGIYALSHRPPSLLQPPPEEPLQPVP